MSLLYIFFLAFAISLDGFFVGVTYGIRRIKVGLTPLLIISATSGLVIFATMTLGSSLLAVLSPEIGRLIGAIILIGVGMLVLQQTYKSLKVQNEVNEGYSIIYADEQVKIPEQVVTWQIKPLGIIIKILREPTKADLDASGSISNYEAIFLGLALALDALGAGFGAALTGFNPILVPVVVALTKYVFVSTGNLMGARFANLLNNRTAYLPGLILVLLGVVKLF